MNEAAKDGPRSKNQYRGLRLLVVVAAVVILCPNTITITRRFEAKRNKALVDITVISLAVNFFKDQTERYPSSLEELLTPPADAARWGGPYLDGTTVPLDPWGRSYVYALDRDGFTVTSYGAEGVEGGTGEDTDITGHDED